MEIQIEWHDSQFNVLLLSKAGAEPFVTLKGCRVVDGSKGPFVSWPATKNQSTGKYWSHVWGSDKFNAAVLEKVIASQPRQAPKGGGGSRDDSDIPFSDPLKGKLWSIQ